MPTARRGESVLFVGESHSMAFSEQVVFRGDAPPLACQAIFVGNAVSMVNVTDPDGRLCHPFRRALRTARLLVDDDSGENQADQGVFNTELRQWRRIARRSFSVQPLIVVCLGSHDIFRTIVNFPGEDFELPTERLHHPLAGPFRTRTLSDAVERTMTTTWFVNHVAPLRQAFVRLRELGLERLAFLSVVPPSLDDVHTRRVVEALGGSGTPGRFRPAFRYKTALLLNALAAEVCEAEGAMFLDAWPLVTQDGLVKPGMLGGDGVHLSPTAVADVLTRVIAPAAERSAPEPSLAAR